MKTIKKQLFQIAIAIILAGCNDVEAFEVDTSYREVGARGADISWITEMEDNGFQFFNDFGEEQDLFTILKDHSMDSIRLRVWVNPANGYNNIDDTIAKALRVKEAGMQIMIDFHYSDTWADPGHQSKPVDWQSYDANGLMTAIWWHTFDSLTALKNAGITPIWVQVGNETNNGMLWDEGKASEDMQTFSWMINSGYDAVKEVFPDSQVIVHLANCHDNANFRWIFDGLNDNGGKYDIIGASNYPTNASGITWQQANEQCLNNLNDMVSRYNKDVMITEIGVPWDHLEAKLIIDDMFDKLADVADSRSKGIFYWEPQGQNYNGYTLSVWDPITKQPTEALDAFIKRGQANAIASRISNRCIDAAGASPGNDVIQWDCHQNDNQLWILTELDNGYAQIQSKQTQMCIDIEGARNTNGTNALQWHCTTAYNQQFLKEPMETGFYRLKSRASGKCLDVTSHGANNGDSLVLWTCNNDWNQQWFNK